MASSAQAAAGVHGRPPGRKARSGIRNPGTHLGSELRDGLGQCKLKSAQWKLQSLVFLRNGTRVRIVIAVKPNVDYGLVRILAFLVIRTTQPGFRRSL